MFGEIPGLATQYELDNIKPPNDHGEWPEYVVDYCFKKVFEKRCSVVLTDPESDPQSCILETNGLNMSNELATRNFAEYIV